MDKSKITCETLKAIRKQVADANGIVYTPAKCDFEGVCAGTCPACESEREYIEKQISLKRKAGNIVKIAGLVTSLTTLAPLATVAQEMNAPEQTETISLLDEEFFFEFGGIKPEYDDRLDQLTELISQMPGEVIIIAGHTDTRGSEIYNTKLSQKRAEYIRNLILSRLEYQGYNIEDYILIPVGLADFEPNVPNAQTEIEHEQNRRASIFLYKEHSLKGEAACIVNDKVKENFSLLEERLGTTKFNEFKEIWKAKVKNEREK
ncbi:MAG: OmpA family protein [Paludibacteraceae bacterium]|nr:OmpA family protein [Paludibacteraceae bacterium]